VTRLAIVLALTAACSYGTKFRDCQVSCGEQSSCPDGFACGAGNLCRAPGVTTSCSSVLDANPGNDAEGIDSGTGGGNDGGLHAGAALPGVYVTDGNQSRVLVWLLDATGAVSPQRTLAGSNTLLDNPVGIAIDHAGEIVVANEGTSALGNLLVFAPDADGDVAPLRVLADPNLPRPLAVAIGSDDSIFAATTASAQVNADNPTVFHFAPGATTSDRNFIGPARLVAPSLASDSAGDVVLSVADFVGTYAPTAAGSAQPIRGFTRQLASAGTISAAAAVTDAVIAVRDQTSIELYPATQVGAEAKPVSQLTPVDIATDSSTTTMLAVDPTGPTPVFYTLDFEHPDVFVVPTSGSGSSLTAGPVHSIVGDISFNPGGVAVVPQ
jgi:hypothetical protein